jgi:peptidoglycan/xylan/chitin deacetylase (PgdA/CDA1 family)
MSAREFAPPDSLAYGVLPDGLACPPFIPSILYHAVADEPPPGIEAFTVTQRTFSEHVRAFAASGRTTLTISQVAACIRGELAWPARPVAIRFDDGYDDTRASAEQLLAAGLRSTIYVTSGNVGSRHGMTARAVADLAALTGVVEIGAHTVHHPRLDEISRRRAAEEIVLSREMLEHITGRSIDSFAYPHGAYSRQVRQAVVDAGFASAGAVKNALARADDDVFAIPTWTVSSDTSAARLGEVLEGRDVPLSWRGERVRTKAFRWSRRIRRRLRPLGGV